MLFITRNGVSALGEDPVTPQYRSAGIVQRQLMQTKVIRSANISCVLTKRLAN
jgi:hypothetical protein